MINCKQCGNDSFLVVETVIYEASNAKDGESLDAYTVQGNDIDKIVCRKCDNEAGSSLPINFC